MTLEQVEIFADENGVTIVDVPLPGMDALCAPNGFIGIDLSRVETMAQEKVVLSHDLGHYMTGSFYSIYTKFDTRAKHEYRADKWAVHKLMPFSRMKEAMRSGVKDNWEMADYFNVTVKFVKRAFEIYEREGLKIGA